MTILLIIVVIVICAIAYKAYQAQTIPDVQRPWEVNPPPPRPKQQQITMNLEASHPRPAPTVTYKPEYRITYMDGDGERTTRDITVLNQDGDDILAWCHLRHGKRTFLKCRIEEVIDLRTGEVIPEDDPTWYGYSPRFIALADKIIEKHAISVTMMTDMARIFDNRLTEPERRIIAHFLRNNDPDGKKVPSYMYELRLKNIKPSAQTGLLATYILPNGQQLITDMPVEYRQNLMQALEAIATLEKKNNVDMEALKRGCQALLQL